jgi:hypothetical protein
MLSYRKSDHQEMLKRIQGEVQEKGGHIYVLVLATDMTLIRQGLKSKEQGEWQELFREIFEPINGDD